MPELIQANGIDGRTGEYLFPAIDIDELAAALMERPPIVAGADYLVRVQDAQQPAFGLDWEVDPLDVSQAGWAVVFSTDEDDSVKTALTPLIEHRRAQVGDATRFHVLQYRPDEGFIPWLRRHGPAPGTVDPKLVPYYVLLVGSPARIPFEFQYLLDVEYAVGRLCFSEPSDYERYAQGVVEYETTTTTPHDATAVFFGTEHPEDKATALSADRLIRPLALGDADHEAEATKRGYGSTMVLEAAATRAALLDVLSARNPEAGRPALLFTATHGVDFSPIDPGEQQRANGALICQDWPRGPVELEHCVTGVDLEDARVHGMVAFLFACYSAGTPHLDEFPKRLGEARATIAPSPFVAALPKALLGHPNGGALAVVGHIEKAWGYSIESLGRTQLQPYRNALGQILAGRPVGMAMNGFNERYSTLSTNLSNLLRDVSFDVPVDPYSLVTTWIERNDAQDFVVLGDPAVRLKKPGPR